MAHNIETMAYKGATPWHGLGVEVTKDQTIEEWLTVASMDWKVQKHILWMRRSRGSEEMMEVKGKFALARTTDQEVYQICTDRYKPVQNKEVLDFFREYTEAGEMSIETIGALGNGGIIWALARINHGTEFELAGQDKVKGYVLLCNSHDGSLSYQGQMTSIRVVCQNTLNMAFQERGRNGNALFRMRHSRKDRQQIEADAKANLDRAIGSMRTFKATAQLLSESAVDHNGQLVRHYVHQLVTGESLLDSAAGLTQAIKSGEGLLDAALSNTLAQQAAKAAKKPLSDEDMGRVGKAILADITSSPGSDMKSAKNTWWGVLNGVTHYCDHTAGRDRDSALQSAWFGERGTMKQEAAQLAVAYAQTGVQQ